MPSTTTNYGLATYNSSTDQSESFLDYRTAVAGVSAASNMSLIDDAMNDNALAITALEAKKNIIAVPALFDSPNTYLATVSGYTVYATNDVIDVVLDTDSNGTVQVNINSLGLKSLMKINSSGAAVNLDNTNLLADRHYLFTYDGTRWVWIGATSADQIDIGGTSGNLVSIASDGSIEDSTDKVSDLATLALDNLSTVAINTDLVSDTDGTDSLGSTLKKWLAGFTDRIVLGERSNSAADVAGDYQVWAKDTVPNQLWGTNDAGDDIRLDAVDGWIPVSATWTYASASTITVPSGAASIYSVGDKISLFQSTTKYFYVIGVADTVLTLTGGGDYSVANAAITVPRYSHQENPLGFPKSFGYTQVYTGFSADPTQTVTFRVIGDKVSLDITTATNGTSNDTVFTMSLPITVSAAKIAFANVTDNGGQVNGVAYAAPAGTTLTYYNGVFGTAFTNSGTKGGSTQISYLI